MLNIGFKTRWISSSIRNLTSWAKPTLGVVSFVDVAVAMICFLPLFGLILRNTVALKNVTFS
jgi:hypothetical protein